MAKRGSGGISGLFDFGDSGKSSRSTGLGDSLAAFAREATRDAEMIEAAMRKIGSAYSALASGKGIEKYWDGQRASIERVIDALKMYNQFQNSINAQRVLKEINAFEAFASGGKTIVEFKDQLGSLADSFDELYARARADGRGLDSVFQVGSLKELAEARAMLQSAGIDLDDFTKKLQTDTSELERTVERQRDTIGELTNRVSDMQTELDAALSGEKFESMSEELARFHNMTEQAKSEFRGFLMSLGEDDYEVGRDNGKFSIYFSQIEEGILTANQAMQKYREEMNRLGFEMPSDAVATFMSTLTDLAHAVDEIRSAIKELSESFKLNEMSDAPPVMREFAQSAEHASEQTAQLINSARDIAALQGLIGVLKELIDTSNNTGDSLDSAGLSVAKMLDSLASLSSVGQDSLDQIARMLKSLASMNGMTIGKASVANLVSALEALSSIPDTSRLVNLSGVNFHNFDDLHVSKASLRNLAEFLPPISNVNISVLESLANIRWDNLNSLHVDRASMQALSDLASQTTSPIQDDAGQVAVSVVVEPDEPSMYRTAEAIQEEITRDVDVPVSVHVDEQSVANIVDQTPVDLSRIVNIDKLADKFAEAREMLTAIKREIKASFKEDETYGRHDFDAAEKLRKQLNGLHQNFAASKDIVAEVRNLWDSLFQDEGVVQQSKYLDLIDSMVERVQTLGREIALAKTGIEFGHVDLVTESLGDPNAVAADIEEAMRRAKSGVRGVTDELTGLGAKEEQVAANASVISSAVEEAEKEAEASISKLEQTSERVSQAFVLKFDDSNLSSLSQVIQDAIQKASENIKLTIGNVELSAAVKQQIADEVASAAANGTDKSTGGKTGGHKQVIEDETAAIERQTDAMWKAYEAEKALNEQKQREAGWKAADALAKADAAQQKEIDKARETASAYYDKEDAARASAAAAAQAAEDAAEAQAASEEDEHLEHLIDLYVRLNDAERNYENARGRGDTTNMGRWREIADGIQTEIEAAERATPELIELAQADERVIRSMEGFGNAADSATKKLDNKALKRQAESAKKASDELETLQKKMASLSLDNPKVSGLSGVGNFDADYANALNNARAALVALQNADDTSRERAMQNARERVTALQSVIDTYARTTKAAQDLENAHARATKLANQIDLWKQKNPKAYKAAQDQVDEWLATLRGGAPLAAEQLDMISHEFSNISYQAKYAGNTGKTFFQQLNEGWRKFGGWSLVTRSFTMAIRSMKQATTAVKEVDAAMTELRKVTDLTEQGYRDFSQEAVRMATRVGSKLSDTISATAD